MEGRVDLGTAVSVQPVPKAAYRSDFCENTNFCPQRDSNLGPLAQQASVLPLDHCDLFNKRVWINKVTYCHVRLLCANSWQWRIQKFWRGRQCISLVIYRKCTYRTIGLCILCGRRWFIEKKSESLGGGRLPLWICDCPVAEEAKDTRSEIINVTRYILL